VLQHFRPFQFILNRFLTLDRKKANVYIPLQKFSLESEQFRKRGIFRSFSVSAFLKRLKNEVFENEQFCKLGILRSYLFLLF